ncbi:hypothetical protein HMN09_00157700 [Mycena chlorophos]|uniref:Uncharacterized protein n=1 Tax=Mycena chlorophos TaxID=658473 RepID=A0A8H6TKN2_MYCCL|nr:hypothetical protein HMN09_00157700 [Mycena chlorophos]
MCVVVIVLGSDSVALVDSSSLSIQQFFIAEPGASSEHTTPRGIYELVLNFHHHQGSVYYPPNPTSHGLIAFGREIRNMDEFKTLFYDRKHFFPPRYVNIRLRRGMESHPFLTPGAVPRPLPPPTATMMTTTDGKRKHESSGSDPDTATSSDSDEAPENRYVARRYSKYRTDTTSRIVARRRGVHVTHVAKTARRAPHSTTSTASKTTRRRIDSSDDENQPEPALRPRRRPVCKAKVVDISDDDDDDDDDKPSPRPRRRAVPVCKAKVVVISDDDDDDKPSPRPRRRAVRVRKAKVVVISDDDDDDDKVRVLHLAPSSIYAFQPASTPAARLTQGEVIDLTGDADDESD